MRILGTGLSGLVGSRVVELLKDQFDFENLSLETGVDITDGKEVSRRIKDFEGSIVLHMAAKTDVDGCEKDKPLGEKGDAWRINVKGTRNIVDACKKTRKKIFYISTDFVFDGEGGPYSEDDNPNPINWYGQTKLEGEKIVQASLIPYVIARIAYPYRANFKTKKDFVRAIIGRLKVGEKVEAVTDHVMTPTFIDDIARALKSLLREDTTGIYHVVGSQHLSPYEASICIAKTFGYDVSLVCKTTREKYFKGRAPRPFRLALKNDRIRKLGIIMQTFEEGLREVKSQL